MESIVSDAPFSKKEGERLHKKCCIYVHSKRARLADPDGISSKAAVDGLTEAGILPDDSAKFIEKISYSQEVAKDEETIIDIVWG